MLKPCPKGFTKCHTRSTISFAPTNTSSMPNSTSRSAPNYPRSASSKTPSSTKFAEPPGVSAAADSSKPCSQPPVPRTCPKPSSKSIAPAPSPIACSINAPPNYANSRPIASTASHPSPTKPTSPRPVSPTTAPSEKVSTSNFAPITTAGNSPPWPKSTPC